MRSTVSNERERARAVSCARRAGETITRRSAGSRDARKRAIRSAWRRPRSVRGRAASGSPVAASAWRQRINSTSGHPAHEELPADRLPLAPLGLERGRGERIPCEPGLRQLDGIALVPREDAEGGEPDTGSAAQQRRSQAERKHQVPVAVLDAARLHLLELAAVGEYDAREPLLLDAREARHV